MTLTFQQVKSMVRGVDRVEELDGYYYFLRFSRAEAEEYTVDLTRNHYLDKMKWPTGVRWAFITNSEHVSFSYKAYQSNDNVFDIWENGALVNHITFSTVYQKEGKLTIPLSKGEKLVEIYPSRVSCLPVKDIELDDGATFAPAPMRKYRMLSYGDSITNGANSSYPSYTMNAALARLLNAESVNKAISGEFYYPPLVQPREDGEVPDWITLGYGTNDWKKLTKEQFEENCRGFLDRLIQLYPKTPIFMFTPTWRADLDRETPFGENATEIHRFMEGIGADYPNVTVISCWNFVPHRTEFFKDNRLHPNDLGFGIYVSNIYRAILPHLIEKVGYQF